MKNLNKIVYTLKERLTNYYPSDDSQIPDELIEDKILDVRAILIRDAYKEKHFVDPIYYSKYRKLLIETERVNSVDPPILFSTIPLLVDKIPNIRYLGSGDGKINYERVSRLGFDSVEGKIFTDNDPVVLLSGNLIYYKNIPPGQKYARFEAVFYDPRKDPDFSGIIVPATLIEKLEYVVFNELVQSEKIPKDLKNDEEDLARTVGTVKQAK